MGVPSFYRWLANKYPKIVSDAIEELKGDCSLPNPNGVEFDNFYLDMNGIIHPCFHPDDNLFSPTTFDEVFSSMYEYIDHLFNIVRPRKLLYLAIDGVAPRAKMNQQRARRFRTSKDSQMAEEMEETLRKQFEKEGKALLPKQESQVADSNVITPGTEFMHMLSKKLQSYVRLRMTENPAWRNIKVILSDDTVPGEGEHKIMSFIRAQRSSPGYEPNTKHCLYGLDADLIMLALATHEIHFSILREDVLSPKNEVSHASALENSLHKAESEKLDLCKKTKQQRHQFLNVWVLREYLALDMEISSPQQFEYDFERIVDDFIFICFFAGNDFLPHMPGLEIHENCVDLLMHVYKKELQNLGGYLVDMQKVEDKKCSYIKLKRVERYIFSVGRYEEQIFRKRSELRDRKLRRMLSEYKDAKEYENKNLLNDGETSDIVVSSAVADFDRHKIILFQKEHENRNHLNDGEASDIVVSSAVADVDRVLSNTKELKQKLKDYRRDQSDLFKDGCLGTDKVKFGTAGWRQRYYGEKFSAQSPEEIETTRKAVVAMYGEGICWVLQYYFFGVPSWTWFYPFHYGPLASDMKGLSQTKVKFQKGLPFKPFDQLMGVLPPRSAHSLPIAYKGLMTDKNSNIIDFYPTEFETDTDGKRFIWQGISKLPFIEENRLLTETRKLENELKDHEKVRNSQTLARLFVRCSSEPSQEIVLCCGTRAASEKVKKDDIKMESTIDGIKGTIHLMPEDLIQADDSNKGECAINDLCFFYETHQGSQQAPRLLENVNIPEKTVYEEDIVETILWHECRGSNASYQNRVQIQRPIKADHKSESSSQNRAPAFLSKGADVGFSLGRGKTPAALQFESHNDYTSKPAGEFMARTPSMAREHVHSISSWHPARDHRSSFTRYEYNGRPREGSSSRGGYRGFEGLRISDSSPRPVSSWDGETRDHRSLVTRSEYNGRPRAGSSSRGGYRGFEGFRISDSSPRPVSNNIHSQVSSTFRQSYSDVASDTTEYWRSDKLSADAQGGGWRRYNGEISGQTWRPNQSFSGNVDRGRGRGGGWYAN